MLSASDREQARAVLKSQQSALHQRVRSCLEAAYGIRPDADGCLGNIVPAEDGSSHSIRSDRRRQSVRR